MITKKLTAFSQTLLSYKITHRERLPKLPFLLVGENFSSERSEDLMKSIIIIKKTQKLLGIVGFQIINATLKRQWRNCVLWCEIFQFFF